MFGASVTKIYKHMRCISRPMTE